jgi:hypothetical protein
MNLHRLFGVSKVDVIPCKWTQGDSRGRSKAEIDEYNNFLGDKTSDNNSFFIVWITGGSSVSYMY